MAAIGDAPPDLDEPPLLLAFFAALRELTDTGLVLAYHDRSDGGLAITLLEMAFAGRAGLDVDLGAGRGPGRRTLQRGTRRGTTVAPAGCRRSPRNPGPARARPAARA